MEDLKLPVKYALIFLYTNQGKFRMETSVKAYRLVHRNLLQEPTTVLTD